MKSWSFCENCGKLTCRKLLPSFRTSTLSPLEKSCKCGNHIYSVPQVEDVPLLLRNLTITDIRVLRPFDIHCGEYKRVIHGYRQRTGPFRVTWSALTVQDKIQGIEDAGRRRTLQKILIFSWLKKILLTPNSYLCNVEERGSLSFTKFSQRHNTKVWNVRSGHLFIIHQSFVKLLCLANPIGRMERSVFCRRSFLQFWTIVLTLNCFNFNMIGGFSKLSLASLIHLVFQAVVQMQHFNTSLSQLLPGIGSICICWTLYVSTDFLHFS